MTEEISDIRVSNPYDYYAGIGQFVMIYGLAEAGVKRLLRKAADLDPQVAIALLSGVRADAACSLLRRCYVAKGEELPTQIDRMLAQFAVVTSFRNDLLHHGIDFTTSPPLSTNRESVLQASAVREHVIEDITLPSVTADCSRIAFGLTVALTLDIMEAEAKERAHDNLSYAADGPWSYKPLSPANKDRPGRQKPEPRQSRTPPPPP
jgi:hypothetical protein